MIQPRLTHVINRLVKSINYKLACDSVTVNIGASNLARFPNVVHFHTINIETPIALQSFSYLCYCKWIFNLAFQLRKLSTTIHVVSVIIMLDAINQSDK